MNAAIIIVTHNRLEMLKNCLQAARCQGAGTVYVVDNASTDGTGEYLQTASFRDELTPVVTLTQASNLGSAAGFGIGLDQAVQDGHDWLWLMDDDVAALPGSLENLVRKGHELGPCCIVPAKLCADGRLFDYEYKVSRKTLRRRRISSLGKELEAGALIPSNSGNFEGMLLHRDVALATGKPESAFFMCWDDSFYGMRIAEHFPNYYFNSPCLRKQRDKERLRIGKRAFYASSLFSRNCFLRNYKHVLAYLENTGELSPLAWLVYAWEVGKALAITMIFERDLKGGAKLLKTAISKSVGSMGL